MKLGDSYFFQVSDEFNRRNHTSTYNSDIAFYRNSFLSLKGTPSLRHDMLP
eukprot:GAHX01009524.1.p2 GENE.GAHX01009524.1~~GAHX01009524.1.p2  ORF type:complete len:51 (-),score=4.31 GAHX01009524.1:15-167(-)